MSSFLPDRSPGSLLSPPTAQPGPLDPVLLQQVQTLFSRPELIPSAFWTYAVDQIAVAGSQIPISQIQGFPTFTPQSVAVATSEHTVSTTYADLATTGPAITGLADGVYLVMFGGTMNNISAPEYAAMSVKIDTIKAGDGDAVVVSNNVGDGVSVMRILVKTLGHLDGGHTVTAKYRSSSSTQSAYFANRWLATLKVSNA